MTRLLLDPTTESAGGMESAGGFEPAHIGGSSPAPESPSNPSPPAQQPTQSAPPPQAAQGNPPGAAGGTQPSQAQQAQWRSIRDAAQQYGYDLSQYQDDSAALAHLVEAARRSKEANYYAQLGQAIAPHYQQLQAFMQQQSQPKQAERPAWQPPEFDQRWLALVERDSATGVFLAKPGVNPAIADRVNEYVQWSDRFSQNPTQIIEPLVADRVKAEVQEAVRAQVAEMQRQQAVNQIVQRNSEWLYQHNGGVPVRDPQGRPIPTPAGAAYIQAVESLARAGVSDPQMQDALARQIAIGAIASQQTKQQPATPAAAQASPNVNPLQAIPASARQAVAGATEPVTTGRSLQELLRAELAAAGVTDADFGPLSQ